MQNYPLITILTDTKNRSNLISRCIESIQRQTYINYEHIIADGGTDDTGTVVKSYADPRIKYIRVPEGGPVAQTRKAFELSKGDYITFLDDDDEYMPEKLERQLELMSSLSGEYGLIYGTMSYYDDKTGRHLYDHAADMSGGSELLSTAISAPIICGTPSLMFRREAFESIGATWISGIGNERSDWALVCKALKMGWKIAPLRESYLKIYVNHDSLRMSDAVKEISRYHENIDFHQHFLTEYADVVMNSPESAISHYRHLIYYNIASSNLKEAYAYWIRLMKTEFSFKSIASLPYYSVKSFLYGLDRNR